MMKKEYDFSKGVRGKFYDSEWDEECIAEVLRRSEEMDIDPSKVMSEEEFWSSIKLYLANLRKTDAKQ